MVSLHTEGLAYPEAWETQLSLVCLPCCPQQNLDMLPHLLRLSGGLSRIKDGQREALEPSCSRRMKATGALAIHSFMGLAHRVSGDRNLSAANSPDGSTLVWLLGLHSRLTWPSRWQEATAVTLRNGLLSLQLLSALSTSRELQPFPAWHSQRASPGPALWKHCPLSSKQDYLLLV